MPKHKVGDVFRSMTCLSAELDRTIRRVIEHEGKVWYLVEHPTEGIDILEESFFDRYCVKISKYIVGDIWRNRDDTQVFVVIEDPNGDDAPHMQRLTSRGIHHADVSWYESTYGDLTKWEPRRG